MRQVQNIRFYQQSSLQRLMKTQLDRILNSDLNQYKLAVTQRLHSIDHLEECLTERSNFINNFQEILKKELAGSEKSKRRPTQQITCQNKQNLESITFRNHSASPETPPQLLNKNIPKRPPLNIEPIFEQFNHLRNDIENLKALLNNQIFQIRSNIVGMFCGYSKNIVEFIAEEYEQRMKKLQSENERLRHQLDQQSIHRTSKDQENRELNLSLISINQQNDSGFESQFNKIESILSKPHFLSSCEEPISKQSYPDKYVKINNQQEPAWNHFVCQFAKQPTFISCKKLPIKVGKQTFAPVMPSILKKQIATESYDFPKFKIIVISNPPLRQGYGLYKMGNTIVYQGFWQLYKFEGKGKLTIHDYTYEGNFKAGMFDGNGILKFKNWVFRGQFRDNMVDGTGTLQIGERKIIGKWSNNRFIQQY